MIKTIIIRPEETDFTRRSYKDVAMKKWYNWCDEEWYKGWFIDVLRFDFYNKDADISQYLEIGYRAIRDDGYLEITERLKIGL